MSYGARMKELRTSIGYTQWQLEAELDLKKDKIKNIETEKHKISIELAEKIEQKYSISGWWLLTGNGTMLIDDAESKDTTYSIPMLDVHAGAGEGIYNFEDKDHNQYHISNSEHLLIDKRMFPQLTNKESLRAITVHGDSMQPTVKDNSIVVIDESKVDNIDGVYAICYGGQIKLKRLEFNRITKTIEIVSDNSKYPPKTHDPFVNQIPFKILGKKVFIVQ